jgi:hypothetical protein
LLAPGPSAPPHCSGEFEAGKLATVLAQPCVQHEPASSDPADGLGIVPADH